MSDDEPHEGRAGIGRIEAFSDGVIAIIITIMVLELHPPVAEGMDRLWTLWPVFLAYALSYAYVAVYWVNHHRLFGYATRVTNRLMWSNLLLLFMLSLVPFSTSYLGEQHFGRIAVIVYLATLALPALAYVWLQDTIRATGNQTEAARRYHRRYHRKGGFALIAYLAGIALSFVSPWLGIAAAALVAAFWFLPESAVDGLFGR